MTGKPFITRPAWLALVVLTVLLAGAWLVWNPQQAPWNEEADTVGSHVGQIAPDFSVPTLQGDLFHLSEQRGRPTLIFFMAYWCPTCIPEARALAQLKQEYGNELKIVALDIDPTSTPETLANFKRAADNGAFTWAFDSGQEVTRSYEVRALDTTVILDEEGRVVYRDAFVTPYETLREALALIGY